MATVYGSFILGGVREPVGYAYLITIKESKTFKANKRGWYTFHIIGKGGNGGDGGSSLVYRDKKGEAIGSGGSSGSTGAYAIHRILLKPGQEVSIVVTSSETKIVADGEAVTAKAGVNGENGIMAQGGSGSKYSWYYANPVGPRDASGVTASGGNLLNLNGVQGNSSIERFTTHYHKDVVHYVNGGNKVHIAHPDACYTPVLADEVVSHDGRIKDRQAIDNDLKLGGSGGGGNGAWSLYGHRDPHPGDSGGSGGSGGVVIELGYNEKG